MNEGATWRPVTVTCILVVLSLWGGAGRMDAQAPRVTPRPTSVTKSRTNVPPALPTQTPSSTPTATDTPTPTASPTVTLTPQATPFGAPYGLRPSTPVTEVKRPAETLRTPVMFNTPAGR